MRITACQVHTAGFFMIISSSACSTRPKLFHWEVSIFACLTGERRSEIEGMNAILVRGDAMSVSDVEKAFAQIEEVEAVISTIGGTPANPTADSEVGSQSIVMTDISHLHINYSWKGLL